MSKGEILDHLGDGLYRVKLLYAVERMLAQKAELSNRLIEIDTILPGLQVIEMEARAAVDSKIHEINLLIPAYKASPEQVSRQMNLLQAEMIKLQRDLTKAGFNVSALKAEKISAAKRINQIDRIPTEKVVEAWCADYTGTLTGEIAIIDINDEGGKALLVYPGYKDATFTPERDGQLSPRGAQSAEQVFYNSALLPGVQKWRPRYRLAEITRIDNDICDILLDDANSSAQNLDINGSESYSDVPIQYMDCNASAFEEGDRVVVRFFESGPQVIGFESFPRACEASGFAFIPSIRNGNSLRVSWGEPFIDGQGVEINPPLGTVGGDNPAWTATPQQGETFYKVEPGKPEHIGNRNWLGPSPGRDILSWDGSPSRVYDKHLAAQNSSYPAWQDSWRGGTKVYYKLRVLVDLANESVAGFDLVCGAAAVVGQNGPEKLLVVCSDQFGSAQNFRLYSWPISSSYQKTGEAELIFSTSAPLDTYAVTDWYFNASGSRAVCTFRNQPGDPSEPERYSRINKGFLNTGLGFQFSTIWDRYSEFRVSFARTDTSYYARRRETTDSGCGDNKIGVSTERVRRFGNDNSSGDILFPLYVEFVDDREVSVFYKAPARSSGTSYEADQQITTKEYPHPCAGQAAPGGGTYPDTVRAPSIIDELIVNRFYLTTQGGAEIITSEGVVIAKEKFAQAENRTANYIRSDESVSVSASCGSLSIDDRSYSLSYLDSRLTGGINIGGGILALDARTGFCVLAERYYAQNESGSISGFYAPDDAEDTNDELYLRVNMQESTANEREYLSVHIAGLEVGSELVDEAIYEGVQSRTFRSSDYWSVFPFNLPLTDCDDEATQDDSFTDSSYTTEAPIVDQSSRLLDAGSGTIKSKSAASVIYLKPITEEPVFVQYLEDIPDIADYLFQRQGDYVMNRLTVY